MRAIICDKCGETERDELSITVSFPVTALGDASELNLCRTCGRELRRWVKGEKANEHNPSGIPW